MRWSCHIEVLAKQIPSRRRGHDVDVRMCRHSPIPLWSTLHTTPFSLRKRERVRQKRSPPRDFLSRCSTVRRLFNVISSESNEIVTLLRITRLRKVYYRIRVFLSDCKICKNVFRENGWNVDKVELQFTTTKWIYVYDKLFGIIISCAFRKLYFYVRTYITVCEFDYFTI